MDSWIVVLLFILFSVIGRRARQKRGQEPPRQRPPRPRPAARPVPPARPEARLPQRQPRFQLPPPWEPGEPRGQEEFETESWEVPPEQPVPWPVPDETEEALAMSRPEAAPVRDLLERLSTAAQAARTRLESRPKEWAPAEQSAPLLLTQRAESTRLGEIRQRLAAPDSLREAIILSEILRAPKARRR